MKKIICLLLAALMLICLFAGCKQEEETEITPLEQFVWSEKEDGTLMIGYVGHDAHVIIPSEIEGKTVTEIGDEGFNHMPYIETVIIPDTVTVIGRKAFSNCTGLREINLPASLTVIKESAFERCTSLKEITLHSDCIKDDYSIAAFAYSGLERVVLFDQMTAIAYGAFAATELKEITVPASVRSIDFQAFAVCSQLEKVTLPEGLETIGHAVFSSCNKLTEIEIPSTVKEIDHEAFRYCENLKTVTFKGDAPENYVPDPFYAEYSYTIQYYEGAEGFTFPEWNGFKTQVIVKPIID